MIPLALLQVFYKQIKTRTGCDKVMLETGDEFVSVTILKLADNDTQQLKKVFRWTAVNPLTMNQMIEEFNRLFPPTAKPQSTDD